MQDKSFLDAAKINKIINIANFIHAMEQKNIDITNDILKFVIMNKIKEGWSPVAYHADGRSPFNISAKTFGAISCFFDEDDINYNKKSFIISLSDYYQFKPTNQDHWFQYVDGWNQKPINDKTLWHIFGSGMFFFAKERYNSK